MSTGQPRQRAGMKRVSSIAAIVALVALMLSAATQAAEPVPVPQLAPAPDPEPPGATPAVVVRCETIKGNPVLEDAAENNTPPPTGPMGEPTPAATGPPICPPGTLPVQHSTRPARPHRGLWRPSCLRQHRPKRCCGARIKPCRSVRPLPRLIVTVRSVGGPAPGLPEGPMQGANVEVATAAGQQLASVMAVGNVTLALQPGRYRVAASLTSAEPRHPCESKTVLLRRRHHNRPTRVNLYCSIK